jgi:hypothetical protein
MDGMISDIVEREDVGVIEPPQPPVAPAAAARINKFADWRSRQRSTPRAGAMGKTFDETPAVDSGKSKIAQALRQAKAKPGSRRAPAASADPRPDADDFTESEKIHIENLERLSQMTEAEIEREREAILGSMDVNVLRNLLKRAEMKENGDNNYFAPEDEDEQERLQRAMRTPVAPGSRGAKGTAAPTAAAAAVTSGQAQTKPPKVVSTRGTGAAANARAGSKVQTHLERGEFSIADVGVEGLETHSERYPSFEELQRIDAELNAAGQAPLPPSNVHFPKDPTNATNDLNPEDPDFFKQLHEKYYPDLSAEPEKMAWMTEPTSVADVEAALPDSMLPSELRFDFKGKIISPRRGLAIPVTAGLHHHGDAPAVAGYTIPELAHLARSTAHSQRCMAIQTLGRILYRLGHKASADDGDNGRQQGYGPEITPALWGLVDEARVVDSLQEAADEKRTKSMSVRAYAIEALWLWNKGGSGRPAV